MLRRVARAFSSTARGTSATVNVVANADTSLKKDVNRETLLSQLEESISSKQATRALAVFDMLAPPPSHTTTQKLAILLAKRGDRSFTLRAASILQNVLQAPELDADDYTRLASIYVVDACLRHRLLRNALDVHGDASKHGTQLDLPAYNSLIQALVDAGKVNEARELLEMVEIKNEVAPTEETYFPILYGLVARYNYPEVVDLLSNGRARGVSFTWETYDPLVELSEQQQHEEDEEANFDEIEQFLDYVNRAIEDDGLMAEFAAEIDLGDDDDSDDDLTPGASDDEDQKPY